MTVQCRVTVDDSPTLEEAAFLAVPRIGETVSLAIGGAATSLRVSRVVHLPEGLSPDGAAIVLELTSKIL